MVGMRGFRRVKTWCIWLVAGYLIINAVYAAKSLAGVDFLPGHHGALFPIGEWFWNILRIHSSPLSFDGEYKDVSRWETAGTATGQIAELWMDDGSSGAVQVHYSRSNDAFGEHRSAQLVQIRSLGRGARWQIKQTVAAVNGKRARISVTAKCARPMKIRLLIRQARSPWKTLIDCSGPVGPNWTTLDATGLLRLTEKDRGKVMLVISSVEVGTITLGAASFTMTP